MNHICTDDCRKANDCLGEVRCSRCGATGLPCQMAYDGDAYYCDDCAEAIEEERGKNEARRTK